MKKLLELKNSAGRFRGWRNSGGACINTPSPLMTLRTTHRHCWRDRKQGGSKTYSFSLISCACCERHRDLQVKEITQAICFHLFFSFIHNLFLGFFLLFWLFQQSTRGKDTM
jgi:hypothetical protein